MRRQLVFPVAVVLLATIPVLAQRPQERGPGTPRANQGHAPPPPAKRESLHAKPEVEHRVSGHINSTQHVNNDHWYGHAAPNDKRFHLDHPFEHGRFEHFGPSYRYRVERFDPVSHQFWLPGGFYFEVATWDWPICADWCWDCADDFTVYEDPDHEGWYTLYNVHTGAYVHVTYMGT